MSVYGANGTLKRREPQHFGIQKHTNISNTKTSKCCLRISALKYFTEIRNSVYGISCRTSKSSLLCLPLWQVCLSSPKRDGAWRVACFYYSHRKEPKSALLHSLRVSVHLEQRANKDTKAALAWQVNLQLSVHLVTVGWMTSRLPHVNTTQLVRCNNP